MLSISKDANPNYLAKVVKLPPPIKHPNADRMQGWTIDGNRVWTDMQREEGDICIYFPLECAINPKLLSSMNLYSDANQNVDPTVKGYFDKHGRVRAVKLRGEPSEGFLLPFDEVVRVMNIKGNYPPIGYEFDMWGEDMLVWKYVPRTDLIREKRESTNSKKGVKKFDRLVPDQFRLHEDTQQLKKNIHKLSPDDVISISYKIHGTSFVVGNVLTRRILNWKEKVAKWFKIPVKEEEYDLIYASRNVVKNKHINVESNGGYYNEDLWGDIKNYLAPSIQKGFTLYGECVGFTRSGKPIQKDYDYGYISPVGQGRMEGNTLIIPTNEYAEGVHFGVYIYRITQTNVDGKVIELSTPQIIEYCEKYGLKTVPVIYTGTAVELVPLGYIDAHEILMPIEVWRDVFLEKLMKDKTLGFQDVMCHMCKNKVPAEGVVVRKESLYSFEAYKLKSFKFLEKESKDLDKGEVDTETEQSVTEEV